MTHIKLKSGDTSIIKQSNLASALFACLCKVNAQNLIDELGLAIHTVDQSHDDSQKESQRVQNAGAANWLCCSIRFNG